MHHYKNQCVHSKVSNFDNPKVILQNKQTFWLSCGLLKQVLEPKYTITLALVSCKF
jgi:hypothetical protein